MSILIPILIIIIVLIISVVVLISIIIIVHNYIISVNLNLSFIPQTARTRSWGPSGFLRGVKHVAADALDGAGGPWSPSLVPHLGPPAWSPSFAPKADLR